MSHWKTAVSGEQNILTNFNIFQSHTIYIYIIYDTLLTGLQYIYIYIYVHACDTLLACMFSQTTTNTFNQMFFRGKICQLFRRVHFREILSPFQRHQGLAPRITFVASTWLTWFKMFKFQMQFEEIILEFSHTSTCYPFTPLMNCG